MLQRKPYSSEFKKNGTTGQKTAEIGLQCIQFL